MSMEETKPDTPGADAEVSADKNERANFQLHRGFARAKRAIEAVSAKALFQINLDIPASVEIVLGSIPEILAFRDQLALLVPAGFRMEAVDELRDVALALAHANLQYTSATAPADPIKVQALFKARSRLLAHAAPLIEDGHLSEAAVAKHRSGLSHRDVAYNVIGLSEMFINDWDRLKDLVRLNFEEVDEVNTTASEFVNQLGLNLVGPGPLSDLSLTRQKAFTLLVQSYAEVRHGIGFLRRNEGDLEVIAPSLHVRRKRAKSNDMDSPSDDTAPQGQASGDNLADAVNTAFEAPRAPRGSASNTPSNPGADVLVEPPPPAIPLGLPGSPPTFGDE